MPEHIPPFEILYEEGPCLAVVKPPGLLTQAPPQIDSIERRIKEFLRVRDEKPGRVYLGVPHRLDRPVSGVMVFGKHVRAARRLSEQFARRLVRKTYWAFVEGCPEEASGVWRDFVRKVPDEARAEVVPATHPDARSAVLNYRTLASTPEGSWLEIELETGRTHQIRLQAASRGMPVFGDRQYGSRHDFGPAVENDRDRVIALHARTLAFRHPMTQAPVELTAPLADLWRELRLPGMFSSASSA